MSEERILCNCYTGIQAELMANNNIGMTRQEAIKRMAKAIYEFCRTHRPEGYLWYPRNNKVKDTYRACAEAALNALLEGK